MTYTESVLRHLKLGKKVSPMIALRKWGCFRLASCIHEIRGMGYDVPCDLVKRNGKRFGEYRLCK